MMSSTQPERERESVCVCVCVCVLYDTFDKYCVCAL
jgi:hypothetical protein